MTNFKTIDPESFGITKERAAVLRKMDRKEIRYLYELFQMEYHMENCTEQIDFLMEDEGMECLADLTIADQEKICSRFAAGHNCNVADNDQWEAYIKSYLAEKRAEE